MYNKDKTKLLAYPYNKSGDSYTISSSVKEIGSGAFVYNYKIKAINFEGSLDYIGYAAFSFLRGGLGTIYYPHLTKSNEDPILLQCKGKINVYIDKDIQYMHDLDFVGTDVTLYVYDESYALEWAKNHEFPYKVIDAFPVEKELIDEQTDIKVSGLMDPEAKLKVKKIANTVENAISTFDITLQKGDNTIQPDGEITITIPSEIKNCKLFWVKDDGSKVDMEAKYEDGKYIFTTNHLSVYTLVAPNSNILGDVNCDGEVNITDATALQRYLASIIDFNEKQLAVADTDGDGRVSITDVTQIQKYLARLITSLG